jgi:hypothetical protein
VRFNDGPGDRQAQAHARLLGRKEAVEQMRQMAALNHTVSLARLENFLSALLASVDSEI